ncbi:MAG TPA: S9 family peptidase [Gemmatimonadaceae bacterium]|nr:S9 family peptidase [Gemmatimonadaceae bacterium]
MKQHTLLIVALAIQSMAPRAAVAQTPTVAAPRTSELTIERIFASRDFAPDRFGPARWLENGAAYTTVENGGRDIVRYSTTTGERKVLVSAPFSISDYEWSPDGKRVLLFTNTQRVWRYNTRGDYWVLDRATGKLEQLGGDAPESSLMFARFSPDGSRVAYVRANNICVEDLASGKITPLTTDGSDTIINGTSDWVYEEELDLRNAWRWSPDGKSIAYWQFDASGVHDYLLVNTTDSLYPIIKKIPYPKAGTTNSAVRVGVVSASGGPTTWMQLPGDPRNHYVAWMDWAADSHTLAIQQLERLQHTNLLLLADASTGAARTALTERDSAWVEVVDDLTWLGGGKEFLWLSERDGWRHAYVVSRDGSNQRLVTRGAFDLESVQGVDERGGWLYYIASPTNATQRFLYRSRLDGSGRPERLTPANVGGTHSYQLSPDFRWAFHTMSTADTPPVTELVSLPDHRSRRVFVDNAHVRDAVAALDLPPKRFLQVDVGQGVKLDGWLIVPSTFDSTKSYPLLVYVYGEPASTTVRDSWGGSRDLWFHLLADRGYIVASFDNRGTPSLKGRDWRKIIYGSVGVLASRDQAAAVRALARTHSYVDSTRVGVWGWSGGGSMTLNLMFRSPELYKVGMSVASVPDQRLYDTIYQERYMGLPSTNADGYRRGSPINFAEGLRGKLLIVHGSGDDNVHFQGFERLTNRLVELGKEFDMMVYPNRSHCICEGEGTTVHLYHLLTRYLTTNLPAGEAGGKQTADSREQ